MAVTSNRTANKVELHPREYLAKCTRWEAARKAAALMKATVRTTGAKAVAPLARIRNVMRTALSPQWIIQVTHGITKGRRRGGNAIDNVRMKALTALDAATLAATVVTWNTHQP